MTRYYVIETDEDVDNSSFNRLRFCLPKTYTV